MIDSEPSHLLATNRVLETFGHSLSPVENEVYLGMNESRYWKELVQRFEIDCALEELGKRRQAALIEVLKETLPINPGIAAVLAQLRTRGVPLAVASSSEGSFIAFVLERSGLAEFFTVIASGDEVEHSKPAPDVFLLAAKRLGVEPQDCLVFEDSANGINAAHAAAMTVIRVVTETTRNLTMPAVAGEVEDFRELDLSSLPLERNGS